MTRLLALLLSVLLAGCTFYDRRAPESGEEFTLTLPAGTTVEQAQELASVLERRIEPAGWRWSRFEPAPDKLTVRVGPLDAYTRSVLERMLTAPYDMAMYVPPAGADPSTWAPSGAPVFTDDDVVESYIEAMRKGTRLSLTLNKAAARRLQAATSPDGGALVFFVDGAREMATLLDGPLRGGIVKLTPAGDDKDAIHLRAVELISALKAGDAAVTPVSAAAAPWGP